MRMAVNRLLTSTSSRHAPRSLAAAVALGVLCGCIPWSSPLCFFLLAIAFSLPIHLPLCLGVTLAVQGLALFMPAAIGEVGVRSLTHPMLAELWLRVETYPLVPWMGLHNALVNGGLLCGTALLLPVYLFSRSLATWLAGGSTCRSGLGPLGFGESEIDLAIAPVNLRRDPPQVSEWGSRPQPVDMFASEQIADLEDILQESRSSNPASASEMDTAQVLERAANVAALVDDLLATLEEMALSPEPASHPMRAHAADFSAEPRLNDRPDVALPATASYRGVLPTSQSGQGNQLPLKSMESPQSADWHRPNEQFATDEKRQAQAPTGRTRPKSEEPMIQTCTEKTPSSTPQETGILTQHEAHREQTRIANESKWSALETRTGQASDRLNLHKAERQAEALRYLLNHLRQLSEKV